MRFALSFSPARRCLPAAEIYRRVSCNHSSDENRLTPVSRCTQEMKELAALAYRDTTAENREFWKNEMGQAMREIQQVYEDKLDTMRSEVEASYSLKVTELFVSTL